MSKTSARTGMFNASPCPAIVRATRMAARSCKKGDSPLGFPPGPGFFQALRGTVPFFATGSYAELARVGRGFDGCASDAEEIAGGGSAYNDHASHVVAASGISQWLRRKR